MTLQEFADKYKVKIKKDSCDDSIIPGKLKGAQRVEDNHHVFEAQGKFSVYLNMPTTGRWSGATKRLLAAGAYRQMTGRMDGYLGFDPDDEPLVKLVLKTAKIRVRRQLTEEQKANIRQRFTKKP
jgi:hypothetical protein